MLDWYPEIMYEEDEDGLSSKIPFIMVPPDEAMPSFLFIFESRETGEFEPGMDGEDLPVSELDLHQYASMAILKNQLNATDFDKVRDALGLEPLAAAAAKGAKITSRVKETLGVDLPPVDHEYGSD
jgi:hypothetical protein